MTTHCSPDLKPSSNPPPTGGVWGVGGTNVLCRKCESSVDTFKATFHKTFVEYHFVWNSLPALRIPLQGDLGDTRRHPWAALSTPPPPSREPHATMERHRPEMSSYKSKYSLGKEGESNPMLLAGVHLDWSSMKRWSFVAIISCGAFGMFANVMHLINLIFHLWPKIL